MAQPAEPLIVRAATEADLPAIRLGIETGFGGQVTDAQFARSGRIFPSWAALSPSTATTSSAAP